MHEFLTLTRKQEWTDIPNCDREHHLLEITKNSQRNTMRSQQTTWIVFVFFDSLNPPHIYSV